MRKIKPLLFFSFLIPLLLLIAIGGLTQKKDLSSYAQSISGTGSILNENLFSLSSSLTSLSSEWKSSLHQEVPQFSDKLHLNQSGMSHFLKRNLKEEPQKNNRIVKRNDPLLSPQESSPNEITAFKLAYYYHSLPVVKKNYLDPGIRVAIAHNPQKKNQNSALSFEFSAWSSQEVIEKVIENECGLDKKCINRFKTISLADMPQFPIPLKELKGLQPIYDKRSQQYICPIFKKPEHNHLNPLIRLVATEQIFNKENLKESIPKIWIPTQALKQPAHVEKNIYTWDELGFDNTQSTLFGPYLKSQKNIICLPYEAFQEILGDVGGSCSGDMDCLSGCCQNGVCSAHDPQKNIFCNKEKDETCLHHEYCQYSEKASLWGGSYKNKRCKITNSFQGREHFACFKNKCTSDNGGLVTIQFNRDLSEKECRGLEVPAPDEITVYKLDKDRKIIMKNNMPEIQKIKFEK